MVRGDSLRFRGGLALLMVMAGVLLSMSTVGAVAGDTLDISVRLDNNIARFVILTEIDIESVTWSFGDGEISDEVAPMHVYDAIGEYTLTVTVMTSSGSVLKASRLIVVSEVYPVLSDSGSSLLIVTSGSVTAVAFSLFLIFAVVILLIGLVGKNRKVMGLGFILAILFSYLWMN